MKKNKFFKGISYGVLSITIIALILSIMCIAIKNSKYFSEEKYFNSESFSYDYLMTLREISNELIHNNSSYNCIKDGEMEIYHLYDSSEYTSYSELKDMNFLIIYKNKAITNINANTIDEIKKKIESDQSKKVDILNGNIQTDSQSISRYGNKYLNNFIITYYTTDTNKTDTTLVDGRYIEYITANIKEFEIYSSYKEELNQNFERKIALNFLNTVKPINDNAYVIFPASSILTILLIIYLVISVGHSDEVKKVEMNSFDNIPIEIVIFFAILISCIPFVMLEVAENNYDAIISIAITAYFVIYICSVITMTTIIKRIKAKQFLRTSIIGKILIWWLQICKKIVNKIKDIWKTITYSAKTTSKVIISASIMIFLWIVIALIFENSRTFPLVVVAFLCFCIYKVIKISKEYSQIENKLKEIYDGNNKNELNQNEFSMLFKSSVTYLNDISNGFENAVQERMKSERMKAELITNVSHDIKTPLTSIINYVDLLKQENIQNSKAEEYIEILDNKSQRLKKLTEDLVEASKISTGNISLKLEKINVVELIKQATGEFEDKFKKHELEVIVNSADDEINIMADSRYMYRIIENLYSNISKYALENSRVYIDVKRNGKKACQIKPIYVIIIMLPIKLHFSSEYMQQSKKIFKEENKMARKENLVKALFILACLSILDLTRKFSVGGSMSSSMTGFMSICYILATIEVMTFIMAAIMDSRDFREYEIGFKKLKDLQRKWSDAYFRNETEKITGIEDEISQIANYLLEMGFEFISTSRFETRRNDSINEMLVETRKILESLGTAEDENL